MKTKKIICLNESFLYPNFHISRLAVGPLAPFYCHKNSLGGAFGPPASKTSFFEKKEKRGKSSLLISGFNTNYNSNSFLTRSVKVKNSSKGIYWSKNGIVSFNSLKGIGEKGENFKLTKFFNQCFDKNRLKNFVLWFLLNYGENKTVELVEQLKNIGFYYASKAGISLGIDDLKIPPKKAELIYEAEKKTSETIQQYVRGEITGVERFQRLIDTWHRTSEVLKQEVINNFESTDILNPVYMMAFSGARGNISQVRQLVGMRGLMADPQGQIIDFPIRSNFREGLTLTEYIISSYGARKGIVDTALRTANAGYLTRRLVDVAQHVVVSKFDCGTQRGIFLINMKEGNKIIHSLSQRIVGRILARDLFLTTASSNTNNNNNKEDSLKDVSVFNKLIAKRNEEVSLDLAFEIGKNFSKVFVRSPLTCETPKCVCQLCYGWSLGQGKLVSIGEAVGVVAAQSIGEPGTQLTMRTFHTGGVFSGDISDQIRAPFNGIVEFLSAIPGTLIRTPEGQIAFLTKGEGYFMVHKHQSHQTTDSFTLNSSNSLREPPVSQTLKTENLSVYKSSDSKKYKIPHFTLLYIRNGQTVIEKEVIAQITTISRKVNATDDAELTIKSEYEGQFYSKSLGFLEKQIGPKIKKEKTRFFQMEHIYEAWTWGYAWILSGKIYESSYPLPFFAKKGDFFNQKSALSQTKWNFYLKKGLSYHLNLSTHKTSHNTGSGGRFSPNRMLGVEGQNHLTPAVPSLPSFSVPTKTQGKTQNSINFNYQKNVDKLTLKNQQTIISFNVDKIHYKNYGYVLQLQRKKDFLSFPSPFNSPSLLSPPRFAEGGKEARSDADKGDLKTTYTYVNKKQKDLLFSLQSFETQNSNISGLKKGVQWFPQKYQTLTAGSIVFFDSNKSNDPGSNPEIPLPKEGGVLKRVFNTPLEKRTIYSTSTLLTTTNASLKPKYKDIENYQYSTFNIKPNNLFSRILWIPSTYIQTLTDWSLLSPISRSLMVTNSNKNLNKKFAPIPSAFASQREGRKGIKSLGLANNPKVISLFMSTKKDSFIVQMNRQGVYKPLPLFKSSNLYPNSYGLPQTLLKLRIESFFKNRHPFPFQIEDASNPLASQEGKEQGGANQISSISPSNSSSEHVLNEINILRYSNSNDPFQTPGGGSESRGYGKERGLHGEATLEQDRSLLGNSLGSFSKFSNMKFLSFCKIFGFLYVKKNSLVSKISSSLLKRNGLKSGLATLRKSLFFKSLDQKQKDFTYLQSKSKLNKLFTHYYLLLRNIFSLSSSSPVTDLPISSFKKPANGLNTGKNQKDPTLFINLLVSNYLKKQYKKKLLIKNSDKINVYMSKFIKNTFFKANITKHETNVPCPFVKNHMIFLQNQYKPSIISLNGLNLTNIKNNEKPFYLNFNKKSLMIQSFSLTPTILEKLGSNLYQYQQSKIRSENQNQNHKPGTPTRPHPVGVREAGGWGSFKLGTKAPSKTSSLFGTLKKGWVYIDSESTNLLKSKFQKDQLNICDLHQKMFTPGQMISNKIFLTVPTPVFIECICVSKVYSFEKEKEYFYNLDYLLPFHIHSQPIKVEKVEDCFASEQENSNFNTSANNHINSHKLNISSDSFKPISFIKNHKSRYYFTTRSQSSIGKEEKAGGPSSNSNGSGFNHEIPSCPTGGKGSEGVGIPLPPNPPYGGVKERVLKNKKEKYEESIKIGALIQPVEEYYLMSNQILKQQIYEQNPTTFQNSIQISIQNHSILTNNKNPKLNKLFNAFLTSNLVFTKDQANLNKERLKGNILKFKRELNLKKNNTLKSQFKSKFIVNSSFSSLSYLKNNQTNLFNKQIKTIYPLAKSPNDCREGSFGILSILDNLIEKTKISNLSIEQQKNKGLLQLAHTSSSPLQYRSNTNLPMENMEVSNSLLSTTKSTERNAIQNKLFSFNKENLGSSIKSYNGISEANPILVKKELIVTRKPLNLGSFIINVENQNILNFGLKGQKSESYSFSYEPLSYVDNIIYPSLNKNVSSILLEYINKISRNFELLLPPFAKRGRGPAKQVSTGEATLGMVGTELGLKVGNENENKRNFSKKWKDLIPYVFESPLFAIKLNYHLKFNLLTTAKSNYLINQSQYTNTINTIHSYADKPKVMGSASMVTGDYWIGLPGLRPGNKKRNKKRENSATKLFYEPSKILKTSQTLGKTTYYSPFKGEIVSFSNCLRSKNLDLNFSLNFNLNTNNGNNTNKERLPINPIDYSCMFLTKTDLASYYFSNINKNLNNKNSQTIFSKETVNQVQTLFYEDKNKNQIASSLSKYKIKDVLVKFVNMTDISSVLLKSQLENSLPETDLINKGIKVSNLIAGTPFSSSSKVSLLGDFIVYGDPLNHSLFFKPLGAPGGGKEKETFNANLFSEISQLAAIQTSGQIIHYNSQKITLRRSQPIFISPKGILRKFDGDFIEPKAPVITLSYQRLKTGDIIQGIPKVEQYFEARTTKRSRLFRDSLPSLLKGLFKRYQAKLPFDLAVRQSFYKIQQIVVDGVQRVYKSQGVTISDKHLEVIVKQMTSKVRITDGAQTGFFPGEVVDLCFVEKLNQNLIKKITYEPLILGITKASLEVDSFLSAASFQQTTRVLSKAAIYRKKDFLKGLKENVILGNLIPAGTGYLVYLDSQSVSKN
jgi:hypothetical protein